MCEKDDIFLLYSIYTPVSSFKGTKPQIHIKIQHHTIYIDKQEHKCARTASGPHRRFQGSGKWWGPERRWLWPWLPLCVPDSSWASIRVLDNRRWPLLRAKGRMLEAHTFAQMHYKRIHAGYDAHSSYRTHAQIGIDNTCASLSICPWGHLMIPLRCNVHAVGKQTHTRAHTADTCVLLPVRVWWRVTTCKERGPGVVTSDLKPKLKCSNGTGVGI